MINPSQDIVDFLKAQESFSPTPYTPLTGDVLTIGYGFTTMPDGRAVTMNDTITESEAEGFIKKLLDKLSQKLNYAGISRPQKEVDAALSLAYNIGFTKFISSGTGRMFTSGQDISDRFILWNIFKGTESKGLSARRLKEKRIYLTGNYSPLLTKDEVTVLKGMGFKV